MSTPGRDPSALMRRILFRELEKLERLAEKDVPLDAEELESFEVLARVQKVLGADATGDTSPVGAQAVEDALRVMSSNSVLPVTPAVAAAPLQVAVLAEEEPTKP